MGKNDCDNCIRNADNDPRGCTISEYAYMTMDADGKCRQYMPKQRRKHEQIRQDHGGLGITSADCCGVCRNCADVHAIKEEKDNG